MPVSGGARSGDGSVARAGADGASGAGGAVPVAEGVAPTRQQAVGMDWSAGRDTAAVGQLVEACGRVDRARVDQLEALVRVVQDGAAEQVLGVPIEALLAQSGRATRTATSRLLKAARVLAGMPALRHAFRTGTVSWPQVDAITWTVTALSVDHWDALDTLIGEKATGQVNVEADSLVVDVEWAAATITSRLGRRRRRTPAANRVNWQPRLDGSGDLHASYDAARFPILVDHIDQLARTLAHPDTTNPEPDGEEGGDVGLTDAARHAAAMAGRHAAGRAAALFELVTGWDHDTLHPLPDHTGTDGRTGGRGRGRAGRPGVLVTADLESLLDGTAPAWLLNRLTGRMRVTADVARRWIDVHGADTRLIVMDDGQPVGVGRRTHTPPGWLRDAVIARDLHDTAPASTTPALLCDLDHTVPYNPNNPATGGPTDVTNLALLSRRWHTRKTRGHLTLNRHPDGSATWTATTSGYRITTLPPPHLHPSPHRPAAWRRLDHIPPPNHPPDHNPAHNPDGSRPPPADTDRHHHDAGLGSHDRAPP